MDETELGERGKKKFSNNTREDKTRESESEQLVTEEKAKKDYNDDNEKLQKNDGELQYVYHAIETLVEQRKDLKNQREKVVSLQHKLMTQMQKNTNNLKSTGKFDKKIKKMCEDIKQDLEMSIKENKELLWNTEKVLDTTENMNMRMTEMKVKLEDRMKRNT